MIVNNNKSKNVQIRSNEKKHEFLEIGEGDKENAGEAD